MPGAARAIVLDASDEGAYVKRFSQADLNKFMYPTRHPRFALRTADGCLSGSLASHLWRGMAVLPVRDYPYEGLTVMVQGENWKVLDGFAIKVDVGENQGFISIKPGDVLLAPHLVTFMYHFTSLADEYRVTVTYYLMNREFSDTAPEGDGLAGVISIGCTLPGAVVHVVPLVDIRHMYGHSAPFDHRVWSEDGNIWVSRSGLYMVAGSEETFLDCFLQNGQVTSENVSPMFYRLGSGFRLDVGGRPVPLPEKKQIVIPGSIVAGTETDIVFACSTSQTRANRLREWAVAEMLTNLANVEKHSRIVFDRVRRKNIFMNRYDISTRALTMRCFGVRVKKNLVPEAGGWWFRTPWFRDVFEGIYNSLEAVMAVFGDEYPAGIIGCALDMLDPNKGLLPNKLEEIGCQPQFMGADAALLAYITADKYLRIHPDRNLAKRVMAAIKTTVSAFESASLEEENGPPVLGDGGLISCPSWHSWTDGKRVVVVDGLEYKLAIRVPLEQELDLIDFFHHLPAKDRVAAVTGWMNRPLFFFPEINAQWIRTLYCFLSLAESYGERSSFSGRIEEILKKAEIKFRESFLADNGYLKSVLTHQVFPLGTLVDETVGSPQMVAAELLSEHFLSEAEVEAIAVFITQNCLVLDAGRPFGMAVRKSGKSVYFDDNEYHEEVMWPRDIPYLVRLLIKTGREKVASMIIDRHLVRQDSEGVIFYNPELYSIGDDRGGDLVPVKNPIQWWSHWIF